MNISNQVTPDNLSQQFKSPLQKHILFAVLLPSIVPISSILLANDTVKVVNIEPLTIFSCE